MVNHTIISSNTNTSIVLLLAIYLTPPTISEGILLEILFGNGNATFGNDFFRRQSFSIAEQHHGAVRVWLHVLLSDAVCSVFCLSGTGEGVSLSQAQKASNTNKEYNNFFIGRHFYESCAANLLKRNEEGKGNCRKMLMS